MLFCDFVLLAQILFNSTRKMCWTYQATYIYVLNENPDFIALGAKKQLVIFVAQVFFGNQAIIQVFRARDQLSSLSGAKIMAHKPKIGYKFKSGKRLPQVVILAKRHNLPADFAKKLFKPSEDSESLVIQNLKNFLVLGLGFLVDDIMIRVGFSFFWMTSSVHPMSWFCSSKLHWILGYNTSLWSP